LNKSCLINVLSVLFFLIIPHTVIAAQWKKIVLPHFEILYVSRDEHYAEILNGVLEGIRDRIVSDMGEVEHDRVKVYIVPTHALMAVIKPPGGNVPPWAAAVAYWERNLILIRSPRLLGGKRKDIVKTAAHEMSHVLLGRAVGRGFLLPRWLNEGFAMYEAGEWNIWDTTSMMWASATNSFYSFEELSGGFPAGEHNARVAYLQSISVISYLLDKHGRETFISFIRGLRKYKNLNYSLKMNYGFTMKQLEKRWLKKARITYAWIPIGTSVSTLWFVLTWLLVAGYMRKRMTTKRKLRQWEEEEAEGRWIDLE